jgi:hypothetical protein
MPFSRNLSAIEEQRYAIVFWPNFGSSRRQKSPTRQSHPKLPIHFRVIVCTRWLLSSEHCSAEEMA